MTEEQVEREVSKHNRAALVAELHRHRISFLFHADFTADLEGDAKGHKGDVWGHWEAAKNAFNAVCYHLEVIQRRTSD